MSGMNVEANPKEIHEAKGAIRAYQHLPEFDIYSIDDLQKAHGYMMGEVLPSAGHFRSRNVGVYAGQTLIHIAPQPQFVYRLIADLLAWLKNSELHPLITSAIFHYEFEFIHPFADGNGRMGRLWQRAILSSWQDVMQWVPIEAAVLNKQQQYYAVLQLCDATGQSTAFVEFILQITLEAVEHLANACSQNQAAL